MSDSEVPEPIAEAVAAVARIDSVPWILKTLCETTGLRFAAVARVTDDSWTACAVEDRIDFGLKSGDGLEVRTTLCREVREGHAPIVIDHASQDDVYCGHPTPKMYGFESYISVPIELPDGEYFGSLCALDPRPADLANARVIAAFQHFARFIALELEHLRRMGEVRRELLAERMIGAQRDQFIAILGHDLRNPLSSIAACGELLAVKSSDPLALGLARRIGDNVRRMSAMVSDVLDLARGTQGGGMRVAGVLIDGLGVAVESVVDELRIANPGRELISNIRIDRPVAGDKGRLQQLVSNLVGNALTHGASDTPIEVSVATLDESLRIEVRNQGLPIAPDMLAAIFDAYRRQDVPAGHPQSGLGLGLYICEQIVKGHGGQLKVTSSQELGTAFVATLPLKGFPARAQEAAGESG